MPIVLVGLAAVLIAILGMLLINGYQQFTRGTANLLPDWHIPGFGSPRDWWIAASNALLSGLLGTFGMALAPLAQFIGIPVRWLRKHMSGWLNAGLSIMAALTYSFRTFVPRLVGWALNQAWSLYHAAIRYTDTIGRLLSGELAAAKAYLAKLANDLTAWAVAQAWALYHAALRYADAIGAALGAELAAAKAYLAKLANDLTAWAVAQAWALYHAAIGYADAVAHRAAADLAWTKAWLIAYCDAKVAAVVNAAIQGEHVLIGRALAGVWPRVIASVDGAIDVAGEDFRDVVADLRSIPRAIEDNPALAAAGTAAAVDALVKLARDCIMPNCRNLSQVGRDIQSLFGLVEGDLIVGLLAEAARDPEAVAREALAVAKPVLDTATSIVRDQVAA